MLGSLQTSPELAFAWWVLFVSVCFCAVPKDSTLNVQCRVSPCFGGTRSVFGVEPNVVAVINYLYYFLGGFLIIIIKV